MTPCPTWYKRMWKFSAVHPFSKGTRVPVETFFDYIQGGDPLTEFLEDFPTVTQEQVLDLLEEVKSELLQSASVE